MNTTSKTTTRLVGHIGIDAGLCWIGDPCYVLPDDATSNPGPNWGKFCDQLGNDPGPTMKSFPFPLGHEGLGVCVSTGYGDGLYPVTVEIAEDEEMGTRIKSVTVTFIED